MRQQTNKVNKRRKEFHKNKSNSRRKYRREEWKWKKWKIFKENDKKIFIIISGGHVWSIYSKWPTHSNYGRFFFRDVILKCPLFLKEMKITWYPCDLQKSILNQKNISHVGKLDFTWFFYICEYDTWTFFFFFCKSWILFG